MLTTIEIEKLRGILDGKLEQLSPLTVLVGPNSSGKSTVLEAMLIGAGRRPDKAVGIAVSRRAGLRHGARWLLWQGAPEGGHARIKVTWSDSSTRTSELRWSEDVNSRLKERLEKTSRGPFTQVVMALPVPEGFEELGESLPTAFGADNQYGISDLQLLSLQDTPEIRLVDSYYRSFNLPLHEGYSRAVRRGNKKDLIELLAAVIPRLSDMEILTEHEAPTLYLHFGDEIPLPAELAGDGVQTLLHVSLELTARPSGTVLLEEPEVHQHPAAIRQTARAIVEAVRREIQVVLSTHSLELIDALLSELKPEELDLFSVFRTKLDRGQLQYSRIPGSDVLFARDTIGDDLR